MTGEIREKTISALPFILPPYLSFDSHVVSRDASNVMFFAPPDSFLINLVVSTGRDHDDLEQEIKLQRPQYRVLTLVLWAFCYSAINSVSAG